MARLIESFLEEIKSSQTCRAYRRDLTRFFGEPPVDPSVVQATDADDVQAFLRSLERQDLSASTQRRGLSALRGFFDWLIEEGVVSHNPARMPQVKLPESTDDSGNESLLSKGDVQDLIAAAGASAKTGLRDQALVLTIVYAALRRSEVAALEVEDVRPLGRYWVLDLDDVSQGGGYVRIPQTVVDAIERMQEAYDITSGPLWRSFSNQNRGRPMTPDAIYKTVRRVSKRAGLEPVSIDTLRQTGLQLALQGGASMMQVQAHGRFGDLASAARLHGDERPGALGDSAVGYIDLDVTELTDGA